MDVQPGQSRCLLKVFRVKVFRLMAAGLTVTGLAACRVHHVATSATPVPPSSSAIDVSPSPTCALPDVWVGGTIASGCLLAPRHYRNPACRAGSLALSLGSYGAIGLTHGGQEASLELRTAGNHACTVSGRPTVRIWDDTGHLVSQARFLPSDLAQFIAVLPGPVLLLPHSNAPHGRAIAVVSYSATQDDYFSNPSDCRARPVRWVEVSLPGIGFRQRIGQQQASRTDPGLGGCGFTYFLTPFIPEDGPAPAP